ncbi:nucleoside deaminase [Streptomyces sp. GESEQ-35]|uniref:nucleoside deaminase n=1 Tax=Streptomyces sp. GESEQ-35 TaxID=2812657 RepID=UPI0027E2B1C9|nr:nucleoside deaminase [Streptomyces sp. GESEQ-35]
MIDIAKEYRELVGVNVVLVSGGSKRSWGTRVRNRAPQGARGTARPAPTGPRRTNRLCSEALGAHAEVVALGLAQRATGGWDLGGQGMPAHELVVNWRPCVQCYGATLWSGVRGLVVAGEGPELEEITTFDEGPLGADWAEQFEARGIEVVRDVLRYEALAVFRNYRDAVDADGVVYNARGGAV